SPQAPRPRVDHRAPRSRRRPARRRARARVRDGRDPRGDRLHRLAAAHRRPRPHARAPVRRPLRYYRQFEGPGEEEANERLRAQAGGRRARELARVEPVDLSRTTWGEYPPSAVVNAITYAARRGLHRYLDPHATALRSELAHRHGVEEEQVVVG